MKRALMVIAVAAFLVGSSVLATADVHAQGSCHFILGFSQLRELIGDDIVGDCVESEHMLPNGDVEQSTTGGVLVWRQATNTPAFTDGTRTWLVGPFGLQQRLSVYRFIWETVNSDVDPGQADSPCGIANPQAVSSGRTQFPTMIGSLDEDGFTVRNMGTGRGLLVADLACVRAAVQKHMAPAGMNVQVIFYDDLRSAAPLLQESNERWVRGIQKGDCIPIEVSPMFKVFSNRIVDGTTVTYAFAVVDPLDLMLNSYSPSEGHQQISLQDAVSRYISDQVAFELRRFTQYLPPIQPQTACETARVADQRQFVAKPVFVAVSR